MIFLFPFIYAYFKVVFFLLHFLRLLTFLPFFFFVCLKLSHHVLHQSAYNYF